MCCVKTLIIFPVAVFHFPIVPGSKGQDDFVTNPMQFQMFLEEGGLFSIASKTVGEFRSIVWLDVLDGTRKSFY